MSIQIKLKNSVVQDSTPSTSDLPEVGELAVNANINSIGGFMRASDNTIVKIFGPGSLSTPTATTTVSGISELATNSETTTGTATNRVVTPAGLNAVTVAERTTSNTNYVAKAGSTMTGVLTATAGSNSTPAINFGDSDSGIFGGTNTVSLAAGGTTRLTANTGVDITGTLAVTGAITSTSDLTIPDKIIHSGDTDTAIRFPAANAVSVETGGAEAFRVDSSQRLLVGTSTTRSTAGRIAAVQIENNSNKHVSIVRTSNDNGGAVLALGKTRAGSIIQNNDSVGIIAFVGDDGTDLDRSAAQIIGEVDGAPGTDDMPGRLVFSTTADSASSPTTRLTIDSAGLVKLPDNGKFVAGAGSDLQIFHDGLNSYIKEDGTGNIIVEVTDANIEFKKGGTEHLAKFIPDGAVELYYDNGKKLSTNADGIDTDTIRLGQFKFPRTQVNNLDDMTFGHGGAGSFGELDCLSGMLRIKAGEIRLSNRFGNVDMINCFSFGAVELFHNGTKRIETTSSGAKVTGNLEVGSGQITCGVHGTTGIQIINDGTFGTLHSVDLTLRTASTTRATIDTSGNFNIPNDTGKIRLGASNDLQIYHDGSNSSIQSSTGVLQLFGGSNQIRLKPKNDEESIIAKPDGAVEIYFDNSKKFETDANGAEVMGRLRLSDNVKLACGAGADLEIFHNGTDSIIQDSGTGDLYIRGSDDIFIQKGDGSETFLACNDDGAVELYFDASKKFETKSDGVVVTGNLNLSAEINLTDGADANRFIDAAIGTNSLILRKTTGGDANHEELAKFVGDGRVELMFDGTAKLRTVTTGTELLGQADLADTSNSALVEPLRIRNGGTGAGTNVGMQFFNGNGTSSGAGLLAQIQAIDVGNFDADLLFTTSLKSTFSTGGCVERLRLTTTGATITGDQTLTGNLFIGAELNLMSGSTNANRFIDSSLADGEALNIRSTQNGDANHENMAVLKRNGAVELYFDNSKKFETVSNGIKVTNFLGVGVEVGNSLGNRSYGIAIGDNDTGFAQNGDGTLEVWANNDVELTFDAGGNGGRAMFNHSDTGSYNANVTCRENSSGPFPFGAIGQSTNQGLMGFFNGTGTLIGDIAKSGSSVQYNTSSDYRLKENDVAISDGITRIKQLRPIKFNWKEFPEKGEQDGFFAHEVSSVVPEAVTGDKDGIITQEYIDAGKELQAHLGKPIIQSLDHSKLVPLLVAAVKELVGRVEKLEAA